MYETLILFKIQHTYSKWFFTNQNTSETAPSIQHKALVQLYFF